MHSVVWESVLVKYYVQLCVFNLIALIYSSETFFYCKLFLFEDNYYQKGESYYQLNMFLKC